LRISEIEADIDTEITGIAYSSELKLKTDRLARSAVLEENQLMKTKFRNLLDEVEENKKDLARSGQEEKKHLAIIRQLEVDIGALNDEVKANNDRNIKGTKQF
jgi:hypothetical protein